MWFSTVLYACSAECMAGPYVEREGPRSSKEHERINICTLKGTTVGFSDELCLLKQLNDSLVSQHAIHPVHCAADSGVRKQSKKTADRRY